MTQISTLGYLLGLLTVVRDYPVYGGLPPARTRQRVPMRTPSR
ncbi:hypothetical protein ACFS07_09940 [Undibacterium arcticum]